MSKRSIRKRSNALGFHKLVEVIKKTNPDKPLSWVKLQASEKLGITVENPKPQGYDKKSKGRYCPSAEIDPLKIDVPKPKKRKTKHNKRSKPIPKPKKPVVNINEGFYDSWAWKGLRYKVLLKYGAVCMLCGATRESGAIICVDHIKPRRKYPELELEFDNMQILCEDCNMGKSYTDETDFRKKG